MALPNKEKIEKIIKTKYDIVQFILDEINELRALHKIEVEPPYNLIEYDDWISLGRNNDWFSENSPAREE